MNIGIDIDDTITYTYETLLPIIAMKYGMSIEKLFKQKPTYKMLYDTLPNYDDFISNHFTAMAKVVPLRDGVVSVLSRLKEQGHKIIFISARNYDEYKEPYQLSYDYLKVQGIPFDKLIVNAKDKARECIMQGIDLFIDDNTKNCKAVKNSGIPTIQFGTMFTQEVKGLNRVNSWEEVYNKVQEMYA